MGKYMLDSEELDLETIFETPQPKDKRRSRNPSTWLLKALGASAKRQEQRVLWDSESEDLKSLTASYIEEMHTREALEDLKCRKF